jgi:DNA (cytosine-5)-methyltransferase 1
MLVLSLFPGIDLFGRGFEAEGFCIVRGPDLIFGGDVRAFHALPGRFDGVIAGSPCPDFSTARRGPPTGEGRAMLAEFVRVVEEARPSWWWLENVPGVPDVRIPGYSHLRVDLDPREFGAEQARRRHFQFGHARGLVPIVTRPLSVRDVESQRCAVATEGVQRDRRSWADFCELQGLPRSFELPGMTLAARYRAVGNGVHILVARAIARATQDHRLLLPGEVRLCLCECGRIVSGRHVLATAACRKRMQRRRDFAGVVTGRAVTVEAASRFTVPELVPRVPGTSQFEVAP